MTKEEKNIYVIYDYLININIGDKYYYSVEERFINIKKDIDRCIELLNDNLNLPRYENIRKM